MKTILTEEAYKKLQDEVITLSTHEMSRLLGELVDAKDRGGVDENSEYDIAREQYERLQDKVARLQNMLSNSVVVDHNNVDTSKVSFLTTVRVSERKSGREMIFKIVPETDIDAKVGKISTNSPIGCGLINKKVGEMASIKTPGGIMEFQILEITGL